MRRVRTRGPVFLLLGALLGIGVGVAVLLGRHGQHQAGPAPSASQPSTTPTTTTVTVPPSTTTAQANPVAPEDLRVAAITPFSATLAWTTGVATIGRVAVGTPALGPTRWLPDTQPTRNHEVVVPSLGFAVGYRAWITAAVADGREEQATLDFTPPPPTGAVTAATRGGAIVVDGSPWFPIMVYGACSTLYPSLLADGITLFAQNPCGGLSAQLAALAGHALSAGGTDDDAPATGAGEIGMFYPDEADAVRVRPEALPPATGLAFLTLSSHVFSGASPPPGGRAVYPGLIARTDVVGLDLYPLQGWCSRDRLADVYTAQRELVALAAGRPTFQWIEAAGMNCPTDAQVAITPETVRAEAWLALIGGAHGLGFFPAAWTGDVGGAIARVGLEVGALLPALVRAPAPVDVRPAASAVRAAAWTDAGSTYVAAVNAGTVTADVTLRSAALGSRSLAVLGESRQVQAVAGTFTDRLDPLQVHIYVAAPGH